MRIRKDQENLENTKGSRIIWYLLALGVTIFLLFVFSNTRSSEGKHTTKAPNSEMIREAEKLVTVAMTPAFEYSFDHMTEGVLQHLDRNYTYDVIPYQLNGGLLFQGIHRPPTGTSLQIELLQPATVYFFFHSKTDGGYSRIFEELPIWKQSPIAPQYDIKNGGHGLNMTMYETDAQPGILYIPATTSDRACFSIVFQSSFGKLAEPDS